MLSVFKPTNPNGTAVVICPGGGYNILAWDLEGTEVAEWLNGIGVTAIVLKYRVPRRKDREKHAAPLQDAQRALALTRHHAKAWDINPEHRNSGFFRRRPFDGHSNDQLEKRTYPVVDEACTTVADRISAS